MAISTDKTPNSGARLQDGNAWYDNTDAYYNTMICWTFDVRDIATQVQNNYPGVKYLESISGYVNAKEKKHG